MNKKLIPLIFAAVLFSSCFHDGVEQPACATHNCTKEFVTLYFKFVDKNGNPIAVDGYKAVNLRTNKTLHDNGLIVPGVYPPSYSIANDADLVNLSDNGDDVAISGTDPVSNQTKTAVVKVSGGCNCHVAKVSGPDQLQFD